MDFKKIGYEYIDRNSKELSELSQFMFQNPELAYKEYKAHDYICTFLEEKGFEVEKHFILETGFRAVYEVAPEPHLVIMVELDALPKLGHACGHNLIAESSIAAGLGLMEIMKTHNLKGKLTLLGTPAEESGGGKIKYVTEGFFKDVTAAILSHPSREDFIHKPSLAAVEFLASYKGKEAHAAVAPWEGINALDAAVLAYQSVSCLRQQISPDCRMSGIITHGGDATNIIPQFAQLKYEVRALNKRILKEILPRVLSCFHAAAKSTGCEVEILFVGEMYDDLLSNKCLSDIFESNAKSLGINLQQNNLLSDGSTDVGNVSYVCPTIQPSFYIGNAEAHTKEFAVAANSVEAQSHTLTQAKAMVGTFTEILTDDSGEIKRKLRENFLEDIKNNL